MSWRVVVKQPAVAPKSDYWRFVQESFFETIAHADDAVRGAVLLSLLGDYGALCYLAGLRGRRAQDWRRIQHMACRLAKLPFDAPWPRGKRQTAKKQSS